METLQLDKGIEKHKAQIVESIIDNFGQEKESRVELVKTWWPIHLIHEIHSVRMYLMRKLLASKSRCCSVTFMDYNTSSFFF